MQDARCVNPQCRWENDAGREIEFIGIINFSYIVNHCLFSLAKVRANWVALIKLSGTLAPELYHTNVHPVAVIDI